jgi:hypothetical protein
MTDDARWLRQFVDEGSQDAFERLVRKHVQEAAALHPRLIFPGSQPGGALSGD